MKLTEDKLRTSIQAGKFERVYFIYGKEPFLISMYADRIIKKTVGEDALDFNLQRLDGSPDPDLLSSIENGIDEAYQKIVENDTYLRYSDAKDALDKLMNDVNGEITFQITGKRPCSHDCASCGGCGG